jgi:hypothetical protein
MLSEEPRVALFSALLLKTEEKLLHSLDFDTSRILAFDFLHLFASDIGLQHSPKVLHFSHFLLVVSQLNPELLPVPRILLAFSALYLANRLFGKPDKWPKIKKTKRKAVHNPKSLKFATLNIFSRTRHMQEVNVEFANDFQKSGK